MRKKISIVAPVYNERENIEKFYLSLLKNFPQKAYEREFIFVNDGSNDQSGKILDSLARKDGNLRVINFTRNFGKEAATSAGLVFATGDAAIIIDCDMQHPTNLISDFLKKWETGALVVVGVRKSNRNEGLAKRIGSKTFYKLINAISETKLTPASTDFRLIDRFVIDQFNKLPEQNRITRGLIDWLGFKQEHIFFDSPKRDGGKASYSILKLFKLALNSMVSLSLFPLRLAGYLGIIITIITTILGIAVIIARYFLDNAWGTSITSTGLLALMIMFLIGVVLICLGLIALYIANIHQETISRPLYVIDKERK